MSDHDPMLDGTTRWDDNGPSPFGMFVLFSDLPALLAAAREGERKSCISEYAIDYEQGHRDGYDKGVQHERQRSATLIGDAYGRGYLKGEQDEREAIDAEITADLTARIQREREDRDPDLLLGGIDYALQNVLRVIRARGES